MILDPAILATLTIPIDVTGYVRIVPSIHASTPLGMGFGKTRFASPSDKFKLIYLAANPLTSIAETIVRDRFQGRAKRKMMEEEFHDRSITEIVKAGTLNVLDVRGAGATLLNIPTDAVQGKNQSAGRAFSQRLYDQTLLDGIIYPSRLTRADCIAVYDRAVGKLSPSRAVELTRLSSLPSDLESLHIQMIRKP